MITSIDWYVENTTVIRCRAWRPAAVRATSVAASVVAGSVRSMVDMPVSSLTFRPTRTSEHTANGRMSTAALAIHSRRLWLSSWIDGTRKSTLLPSPASCSAILSEVKVLPVPQAMISLPRSCFARPSATAESASAWCGRSDFGPVGVTTSGVDHSKADQSNPSSSASMSIRWMVPRYAASAFPDHPVEVSMK